jgi:hypothetical protein
MNFYVRSQDKWGDWSQYASSTFTTIAKGATTSNLVICKNYPLTDKGSVNCLAPEFRFILSLQDSNAPRYGWTTFPWFCYFTGASITIATSSDMSTSSIVASFDYAALNGNESLDTLKIVANPSLRLQKNTKYYYTIAARYCTADYNKINGPYSFTTGDIKKYQDTSYSYDSLNRIKEILRNDDHGYLDTLYTYDDLSRLTSVSKNGTQSESFTYSPTGRILSNSGKVYSYNSNLLSTPNQIGSDILSWDSKGRLSTSTTLGSLNWSPLNRLNTKTINSTTTKYYYDTEGNRILSLTFSSSTNFSSSTLKSKLFTPTPNIQNTGSTTSYLINLNDKAIINIDRSFQKGLTSTSSKSITLGSKNSTSSEFTATTSLSTFNNNSTTSNLNNITKYIGNINNQNRYQQFIFNNLDKSKQSLILYTLVSSSTNKSYPVTITGATLNSSSTITPTNNATITITFTPTTATSTITLQIGNTATTNNTYFYIDSYQLNLITSTTTKDGYVNNIQTLVTDHLNSIEKVLDFNSGNIISTSSFTSFGNQSKSKATNFNKGYIGGQQDQSNLSYLNDRSFK